TWTTSSSPSMASTTTPSSRRCPPKRSTYRRRVNTSVGARAGAPARGRLRPDPRRFRQRQKRRHAFARRALGSRVRTRLAAEVATREELLDCLEHLLADTLPLAGTPHERRTNLFVFP